MRQFVLIPVVTAALAAPLSAQSKEAVDPPSLMERGIELFLEGLLDEIDPALRDMEQFADEMQPRLREFLEEMGPALDGVLSQIEDWSLYHPPEVLDNGDILLRRKMPDEMPRPDAGPQDTPEPVDI